MRASVGGSLASNLLCFRSQVNQNSAPDHPTKPTIGHVQIGCRNQLFRCTRDDSFQPLTRPFLAACNAVQKQGAVGFPTASAIVTPEPAQNGLSLPNPFFFFFLLEDV